MEFTDPQPLSFSALPTDVTLASLSFLSPHDLTAARAAGRHLCALASANCLWSVLCTRQWEGKQLAENLVLEGENAGGAAGGAAGGGAAGGAGSGSGVAGSTSASGAGAGTGGDDDGDDDCTVAAGGAGGGAGASGATASADGAASAGGAAGGGAEYTDADAATGTDATTATHVVDDAAAAEHAAAAGTTPEPTLPPTSPSLFFRRFVARERDSLRRVLTAAELVSMTWKFCDGRQDCDFRDDGTLRMQVREREKRGEGRGRRKRSGVGPCRREEERRGKRHMIPFPVCVGV